MKQIYLIFSLLLFSMFSNAQLVEIGLTANPTIEKYASTHKWKTSRVGTDTLELPFFDDFAKSHVYPDSCLWEDNFVFVNDNFGDNPPTIGVASFDMLNQSGEIYSTASNMGFEADKLTSKPINLDYPGDTTIYLSFYYQPQGLSGNAPEFQDSIILQFTSPDTVWGTVWSVTGTTNQAFRQVIIPIDNPMYLKKGFQFRFINYGSIADNSVASWAGNGDTWNIDFVYINQNRSAADTSYDDISLVSNLKSFLNNYESIPWSHYNYSQSSKDFSIKIRYLKFGTDSAQIAQKTIEYNEILTSTALFSKHFPPENITENTTVTFSENVGVSGELFNDNSLDSANFKFRFYIKVDTVSALSKFRYNDTSEYYQQFYNYYAYDDGTPEAGLGLFGNGTAHAKMAYRFVPVIPDTLRAVKIFFNRTYQDASQKYFIFTVWSNYNGKPDTVIYSELGMRPEYADSLNDFMLYMPDTLMYLTDTFYIGWEKTTEDMLNVGFDKNRDAHSQIFYNIYGTWQTSTISGAMMIRPIFGKDFATNISAIKTTNNLDILLFPNPARDKIFLKFSSEKIISGTISILNMYGKVIKQFNTIPTEISTAEFPDGIFLLLITDDNGNIVSQKKFIVVR